MALSRSFADICRVVKTLICSTCTFLAEVKKAALCLWFQLQNCKQVSFFHGLCSANFFTFLCFSLVILLFKMSLKCSAEVLSSAPKRKKVVMYLMEKVCVVDKLHSGMRYSAVGHEFNVNEPTMYIT